MGVPETKEEALKRVRQIVSSFRINEASYTAPKSKYNETQVRTDYITPLLEAFGWDVYNHLSKPLDLRDVYEEATVEVGEEKFLKDQIMSLGWLVRENILSRQKNQVLI